MNKNLQIIIGISILIIAFSVSYHFLIFLPKIEQMKAEESKTEIENSQKFIDDAISYTQFLMGAQGKCSKSTRNYYDNSEYKSSGSLFYEYFNEKLNKCFIIISGSKVATIRGIEVVEVYENKIYGIYSSQSKKVITCNVLNKICTNKDGFFELLKPYIPYMGALTL